MYKETSNSSKNNLEISILSMLEEAEENAHAHDTDDIEEAIINGLDED